LYTNIETKKTTYILTSFLATIMPTLKLVTDIKKSCFILCLIPCFAVSVNLSMAVIKSVVNNSQCLVHIINTKMTSTFSPNIHSLPNVVFLQTLYPYFDMSFTLCTSMAEKYEDAQTCKLVSAYNRQKLGNDCLLIFVQYFDQSIASLKTIFLEMSIARNGILSPIFYIIVHSANIVEQIKIAALSKNVYMPPPKTIIIWSKLKPEWAYYCYFCRNGGSVLKFSGFSSLPSAEMTRIMYTRNQLDSASNGHGHIATFQLIHVKRTILIQQCKKVLLVNPRRRSDYNWFVLLWHEISQILNITIIGKDFMYKYDSTFDRTLAYCGTCHIIVPQDSSLAAGKYENFKFCYCSQSLGTISISWQFLIEPFSMHIWLLLLSTVMIFAISCKSLWAGMDFVWYIVAQQLQTKHTKIVILVLWMLYVIGVAYTARLTSKVTSPLKPKLIESAKELCEHKQVILPSASSILFLSKKEFEKEWGINISTCFLFNDSIVDFHGRNVFSQLAENNLATMSGYSSYIEKFVRNKTRCFFLKKHAVSIIIWYPVRSYLAKPFIALYDTFVTHGFYEIWSREWDFKFNLLMTRNLREQGLSVDSLSSIPQPFKLSIKKSLVNVFHLLLLGSSVAFLVYAAEHTYHRGSFLCVVSIHSIKVWYHALRSTLESII